METKKIEFRLLTKDDIEVKVKQVGAKCAVALLYKTARTDMTILDETFGMLGWKSSYREVKGNLFCAIEVYSDDTNQWISKEDCGIESREDTEGNEKKGEASDAFKRAGFKWGIGRELYSSPFIFLNVPTVSKGSGFELADKYDRFSVSDISYDEKQIKSVTIVNSKGEVVYGKKAKTGFDAPPIERTQPVAAKTSNTGPDWERLKKVAEEEKAKIEPPVAKTTTTETAKEAMQTSPTKTTPVANTRTTISKEQAEALKKHAQDLHGEEHRARCLSELMATLKIDNFLKLKITDMTFAVEFIEMWDSTKLPFTFPEEAK